MNKTSQSNISLTTILIESQDYISPARLKTIYSSKVQCAIIYALSSTRCLNKIKTREKFELNISKN